MTEDERRRRGGKLCDKLQTEVDAIRPPQVTHSAGEVVASLDADFLIALTAWEGSGEEEDRFRVRDAYLAITDAWNASGLPDAARNEGRVHRAVVSPIHSSDRHAELVRLSTGLTKAHLISLLEHHRHDRSTASAPNELQGRIYDRENGSKYFGVPVVNHSRSEPNQKSH